MSGLDSTTAGEEATFSGGGTQWDSGGGTVGEPLLKAHRLEAESSPRKRPVAAPAECQPPGFSASSMAGAARNAFWCSSESEAAIVRITWAATP
jgi:hypothetical protein